VISIYNLNIAVAAGGRNEETKSGSPVANIETVSEQKAAQANPRRKLRG